MPASAPQSTSTRSWSPTSAKSPFAFIINAELALLVATIPYLLEEIRSLRIVLANDVAGLFEDTGRSASRPIEVAHQRE